VFVARREPSTRPSEQIKVAGVTFRLYCFGLVSALFPFFRRQDPGLALIGDALMGLRALRIACTSKLRF
jgi:hypothetical protein